MKQPEKCPRYWRKDLFTISGRRADARRPDDRNDRGRVSQGLALLLGIIHFDPVAAIGLGAIQRLVRHREQVFHFAPRIQPERHADADRGLEIAVAETRRRLGEIAADPIGNREGAPGLFINAPFGAYLDNFSLSKNQ